ncbi:MAG TPA: M14 family zinc carboxypeptidase [Bryobacteraceae bacterium]|nr:M14 family zinc carboxypeptidase [Bryobacteraceae bacterium]
MRVALILVASALSLGAQAKFEMWPGANYDPAVPTPKKAIGYDFGDRVSSHANIVKYMNALAAAEPNRMKVFEYGKTWEGRELIYAVIGSEANIKRLPEIRANMARLHDPRKTTPAEAQRIIANTPAILWLAYSVHGNEISGSDSALVTAYHLLATRGDKGVADTLANALTIIVPIQNPDGRNRFIHDFEVNEGLEADANPLAAEHSESWPGGRTNHYFFDLNRDWLGITQPETIGHVKALQEWYPQVFIDLHEMGTDATYYFTPESDPYNPYLTKEQHDNLYWFGKSNAKYFDQFGFRYFTREQYDAFYPGYGASWPFYFGGMAMTYENGSTRGLLVRKSDDTMVTYRETVRRHFVTSISSCEVAAHNREKLLDMFYRYQTSALEDAAKDPLKEFVLPRTGDTSAVDKMAQLLALQGVEVRRAAAAFSVAGKEYPAGSYAVSLTQPERRLIRDVLDPQVSMDEAFLKSEEQRRKLRERSEIYDVTAWSLPLQFNVPIDSANAKVEGNFTPVKSGDTPAGKVSGTGTVAYLVPWGTTAAAKLLAGALHENLRVLSADKKFTQSGHIFPAGTLIIMVRENPATLHATLDRLAASSGADVVATNTSWMDDGPDFGSSRVAYLRKPAILMAWDRPTNGTSAGETRWMLEREYGYPVTVIRTQQIGGADLSKFQVIILPEGNGYAESLGANGTRRLHDWVQAGGTLIGLGSAISYMAGNGMMAVQQENALSSAAGTPAGGGGGRGGRGAAAAVTPEPAAGGRGAGGNIERVAAHTYATEADMEKATQPDTQAPWPAHGFLAKAKVDPEQWICAGVPETVYALVSGGAIYTPIKVDRGANAVVFAGADTVMASGYSWEEFRKQLAYKPFLIVQRDGRGNEIGFTADPNYRGYMDGLNLLFLNAVFRGPGHAGGGGGGGGEQN